MKNLKKSLKSNVAKALAVPSGATAGNVVLLGTGGLKGMTLNDRATTATIAAGTAAPGLADGQATVELLGISNILTLALDNAITLFAKVYVKADGTYTATATSNTFIGYALAAQGGAGSIDVAIANS